MPAPIRRVDELGFPLPTKFEPFVSGGDDEPNRPRHSIFRRLGKWRWLFLVLVLALLFGRQAIDFGREMVANVQFQRAQEAFNVGNHRRALEHLDRAIAWEPYPERRAHAFLLRAEIHADLQDVSKSIGDCDQAIAILTDGKIVRTPSLELATAYHQRAWLNERLERRRDALADCEAAMEYCPPKSPAVRANLLNTRAYLRALSGTELEAGLTDIDEAIRMIGEDIPEYADTRAYLEFRLGRYDAALQELHLAIRAEEERRMQFRMEMDPQIVDLSPEGRALRRNDSKAMDHDLAVMYHHRGEVYRKLGQDAKNKNSLFDQRRAEADLQRATQLGFNPKLGVFWRCAVPSSGAESPPATAPRWISSNMRCQEPFQEPAAASGCSP